jgi:hypothetical protein
VLYSLERVLAATLLEALGQLSSGGAIRLAGTLLALDRQHMALLLFALGKDPVPEAFTTTEFADRSAR